MNVNRSLSSRLPPNPLGDALEKMAPEDRVACLAPRVHAQRVRLLRKMAHALWAMDMRIEKPADLRHEHVIALMRHWRAEGLAQGTILARTSHLRSWARNIGRQELVPRRGSAAWCDLMQDLNIHD